MYRTSGLLAFCVSMPWILHQKQSNPTHLLAGFSSCRAAFHLWVYVNKFTVVTASSSLLIRLATSCTRVAYENMFMLQLFVRNRWPLTMPC